MISVGMVQALVRRQRADPAENQQLVGAPTAMPADYPKFLMKIDPCILRASSFRTAVMLVGLGMMNFVQYQLVDRRRRDASENLAKH